MNINELKLKKVKNKFDYRDQVRETNQEIDNEVHRENKKFKKDNRKWFWILDIIIIIIILMNIGALLITNALVMKVEVGQPLPILKEANPVAAVASGYEYHPNGVFLLLSLLRIGIGLGILSFLYVYRRNRVYTREHMYGLTLYISIVGFALAYDFFNDLGFLIGRVIFN